MIIDVAPETFDAASKVFGQTMAPEVGQTWDKLTAALSSTAGMAGTDNAGGAWARQYDPAAQATAGIIADLQNACLRVAGLLEQTGFNHGLAEAASDPSRLVPTPPDTTSYQLDAPTAMACYVGHDVPSAAGSTTGEPGWWHFIASLVGYLWPDGSPSLLRQAGSAWQTAAGNLELTSGWVSEAVEAVSSQRSPEVADATTVCQSMGRHLTDTASACQSLGSSCNQLASHIESAHSQIESAAESLLWQSVARSTGLPSYNPCIKTIIS